MSMRRAGLLFACLLLLSCGGEAGEYHLFLSFPSEAARENVDQVRIMALNYVNEACEDLRLGFDELDEYTQLTSIVLSAAELDQPAMLVGVPVGKVVFYAEASEGGGVAYKGCTESEVKSGASMDVTIVFEPASTWWVEER